jgi:hypothetical protein
MPLPRLERFGRISSLIVSTRCIVASIALDRTNRGLLAEALGAGGGGRIARDRNEVEECLPGEAGSTCGHQPPNGATRPEVRTGGEGEMMAGIRPEIRIADGSTATTRATSNRRSQASHLIDLCPGHRQPRRSRSAGVSNAIIDCVVPSYLPTSNRIRSVVLRCSKSLDS